MTDTTTTYTWAVANLERHSSTGVVYTVHWVANAAASDDETVTASAYGSIGLEEPLEDDSIVPYEDLTLEIVIDWVKDKLSTEHVSSIEESLASQIAEKLNPSKSTGVPWNL